MSEYTSTATIHQVAARLTQAQRVLVTTHTKPDGDAMGSVLALGRGLTSIGKSVDIWLGGPFEPPLLQIAGATPWKDLSKSGPTGEYDTAVVIDTGAWSQLEPIADWLRSHRDHVVGIDHHARGDDIAPIRWIDRSAVSTTAMLAPLLEDLGVTIDGEVEGIGEALFVGLATDSGWFRYGNAGPKAFALAADLLGRGVDKTRLYQIIEETHRPQRLALEARALSSLEYLRDGHVAMLFLRATDFMQTGGLSEDLTGLVNLPMVVGTVRVSILLAEIPDSDGRPGPVKLSFRSKPARPGDQASNVVDVNELAASFGGGGHVNAAGAKMPGPMDHVRQRVRDAVSKIERI